jgi:hypothetical protein
MELRVTSLGRSYTIPVQRLDITIGVAQLCTVMYLCYYLHSYYTALC